MRSTFKVLFYLKCNAPKKDGLIPVMCRITINGKIARASYDVKVGDVIEISMGQNVTRARVLNVAETVRKEDAAAMYEIL